MSGNSHGAERFREGGFKSRATREAREAHRSGPFKAYRDFYESRRETPSQKPKIPERADPEEFFMVGGEIVRGSVFPGGVIPANAIRLSDFDPSTQTT